MSTSVLLVNTSAGPVQITTPAPRGTWSKLADEDPATRITQTPVWLDCICATGPYRDASRLYEFEDGRRLLLPLVASRRRPLWLGEEESWPGEWGIGGHLCPGGVGSTEARAVFDDLERRPANRVSVRFRPEEDDVWARTAPASFRVQSQEIHVLNLEGGFRTVWERRFHQGVRRGVRRAEKSDIDVEVDRTGRLVPVFYDLFEQSIVRWAEQQHEPLALARWRRKHVFPLRLLETVAARLGDSYAMWMAWHAGEPAAAIIVLRHNNHALFWRAAMNRELAHPTRANHLLHRLAIEDLCATGCRQYDFGGSLQGESLARFKESFGTDRSPSARYYRERLPLYAPDRGLRKAVRRAIRFQGY
ncbi:GNAT family N-acetyltransferase [Streptomyces sp. ID05-04B]|uniref:GNAT family N-acetyltransferase n=1 Tax=unclassified Streptomyces TaxID=2593676 RepID=UPI00131EE054|nr:MULTISPECIES: GNAT family N-acetyltransferase [unclassified Streptomyces]MDX5563265.1 GNAT family N-acetyltransferase [Streptomyces sp. ID05-04B]